MHGLAPFVAIETGTLGLSGYKRLLERLFVFHASVRRGLETHEAAALTSGGERLRLLRDDLLALGRSPVADPPAWVPPGGGAGLLGGAYVVQGSTLGGKVLFRQLDYLFGAELEGRRFFCGTSADAGAWSRLCSKLEDERESFAALVDGAKATFRHFEAIVGEPT